MGIANSSPANNCEPRPNFERPIDWARQRILAERDDVGELAQLQGTSPSPVAIRLGSRERGKVQRRVPVYGALATPAFAVSRDPCPILVTGIPWRLRSGPQSLTRLAPKVYSRGVQDRDCHAKPDRPGALRIVCKERVLND